MYYKFCHVVKFCSPLKFVMECNLGSLNKYNYMAIIAIHNFNHILVQGALACFVYCVKKLVLIGQKAGTPLSHQINFYSKRSWTH